MDFFPQVFPYNIYVFLQQAHAHSLAKIEKILINKHLVSCHLLMGKKERESYSPHLSCLKDSDAGRDWGQEEKGTTENEIAGWHHQLDGHKFE